MRKRKIKGYVTLIFKVDDEFPRCWDKEDIINYVKENAFDYELDSGVIENEEETKI